MKKIRLSVGDFAIPSPLTGSLEANSGFGGSAEKGLEFHLKIQDERKSEIPGYQSEVKTSCEFLQPEYAFYVEGRIDGYLPGEKPLIEEFKTAFNIWELSKILKEKIDTHPYCLQLLTYGYFHWKTHNVIPDLNLHLVSIRNGETIDIELKLNIAKYEKWASSRLAELVKEAKLSEKRVKRRKELESKISFPFEKSRSGQTEFIETIQQGFSDQKILMLQAPTGLGKTVGVLYPSLKESLSRGQRVVYVTPKNSQHTVAEEAVDRFSGKGCNVKSLTLTAKSKMCFKAEPLCNPEYCEFAKDYYDKLAKHSLKEELSKKRKLTARTFKSLGEKYQVCPFELQLEATQEADVVICDYNYVFGERSALGRLPSSDFAQDGLPNLVVDEAHNLPARGMGYYSPSLSTFVLAKMREDVLKLPKKFAKDGEEILNQLIAMILGHKPMGSNKATHIHLELDPFLEKDEELRGFLSRYLESDVEIKSKDVVLRLCFYWTGFTDVLKQIIGTNRPEFFFTYQPDSNGGSVKITCCDASAMLEPKYDNFNNTILFSATLKPFDFYLRLSGLARKGVRTEEFRSPFGKDQRKILIIPQVSTKYSERERNYARISDSIHKICSLKDGNYVAFFPSFDFMESVLRLFIPPKGMSVLKQSRTMKAHEVENFLDQLKMREGHILFAVQGGIFSEGVDYPGEMLIGAFVIGPPLPNFDVERQSMKEYYEAHYQEGFAYAYAYPAMAKAIQSAGRVIRSESDRGIIILMDNRFLESQYSSSMPQDWFSESPKELVSSSILKDLGSFWENSIRHN